MREEAKLWCAIGLSKIPLLRKKVSPDLQALLAEKSKNTNFQAAVIQTANEMCNP